MNGFLGNFVPANFPQANALLNMGVDRPQRDGFASHGDFRNALMAFRDQQMRQQGLHGNMGQAMPPPVQQPAPPPLVNGSYGFAAPQGVQTAQMPMSPYQLPIYHPGG